MLTDMGRSGDVVSFRFGRRRVFLLNNPDLIKETLLTNRGRIRGLRVHLADQILGESLLKSEGKSHDFKRNIVSSAFHSNLFPAYSKTIVESCNAVSGAWNSVREVVDIHEEMTKIVISMVSSIFFGVDISSRSNDLVEILNTFSKHYTRVAIPGAGLIERLPMQSNRMFRTALKNLREIIDEITTQKSRSSELTLLRILQEEFGSEDQRVKDEVTEILLAGQENPATVLSWVWHLVSSDKRVEDKLHQEVDRVVGNRLPIYKDTLDFEYLQQILLETLRLYPPTWVMGREATKDIIVDGYSIPRGSIIIMSQFVLHHDSRFFEEPKIFNPERWTNEFKANLPAFSYFPFGGGVHHCLGEHFTMLAGKMIVSTIAHDWSIKQLPQRPPPEPWPRISLRPRDPMLMEVEKRNA